MTLMKLKQNEQACSDQAQQPKQSNRFSDVRLLGLMQEKERQVLMDWLSREMPEIHTSIQKQLSQ